jgi:hypothetical protein
MMHDRSIVALNTATAGMDIVAIVIALAFAQDWGLRVPGWLMLPPIWVASGLLSRFMLDLPILLVAARASGSPLRFSGGPVEPWVYGIVYTDFLGLGLGLTLAFVLYARVRWAVAFLPPTRPLRGATHDVQAPLANTTALLAAAMGIASVASALGLVGPEHGALSSRLVTAIDGALMIAAAAGILALVHGHGDRWPPWLPLAFAWIGSGSLFGWGLWSLIQVLGNTAFVRGRTEGMALSNLLALVRLLVGLVMGLLILLRLAERASARELPTSASALPRP